MPKQRVTCAAWDGGAIADAVEKITGFPLSQNTVKTVCRRRRAVSQIDNEHPTCPECVATLTEREAMARTLDRALIDELRRVQASR